MNEISRSKRWLYGSGDLSFSLANTSIGAYLAIYLTDVVGIHASFAAIIILLGGVWDAFTDPLMGVLSDRTKTAMGRRRPYILFGAIPYGLLYALIWWRPEWAGQGFNNLFYPIVLILFQSASTLVNMPFLALTPELSADYDERNSLTSNRMIFSIIGSLLAFTIPIMIVGEFIPDNGMKVWIIGIVTGLITIVPFVLIGSFIRENPRRRKEHAIHLNVFASFKIVKKNRAFLWALGLFLFSWLAIEVVQALLIYFIKYRLQMPQNSDVIMAAVFVSALISLPFWDLLSRKSDKRKSFIFGTSFWLLMQIVLVLFRPATPLPLIVTVAALAGVGVGAVHVFSWSMIPDSIDAGDPEGMSQEGLYYSVVSFARKLASKGTVFMVLFILGQSGYEANAAIQIQSADNALGFMMGPLPTLLLGVAIFSAYKYPVRRETIRIAADPPAGLPKPLAEPVRSNESEED